jgi:hypothetical protein
MLELGEPGWRIITLLTAPVPDRTDTAVRRRIEKVEREAMISHPDASSRITGRIADSLSRVITTGGFGLFFDPGGLPRGFRLEDREHCVGMRFVAPLVPPLPETTIAPVMGVLMVVWLGVVVALSSSSEMLGFEREMTGLDARAMYSAMPGRRESGCFIWRNWREAKANS